MDEKRCYGCMKLISESVCPHCGHPREGQNAPHQLAVGSVLQGNFLVGRALAQGSGGIVYIALDQQADTVVQLREFWSSDAKRLEDGGVESAGPAFSIGRELFCRQAEALSTVNILKEISGTRGFFEEKGTAYLVIDNIRGASLSRYVQLRGGKLTVEETFRLLMPVIQAVAALHRAGMAHGRIRMENVVLDPMGGARLLAFGEDAAADSAQDVYDLCRLFCGCLAGAGQGNTLRLSDIPGLEEHLIGALEIGLAHDPQERFASAAALERALQYRPPVAASQPEPVSQMPEPEPAAPLVPPEKEEAPDAEPVKEKVPPIVSQMPKTEPATPFFPPENKEEPEAEPVQEEPVAQEAPKPVSRMPKTEPAQPLILPPRPEISKAEIPASPLARQEEPAAEKKPGPQAIAPTELMTDFKIDHSFLEARQKAPEQPAPQKNPGPIQPQPIEPQQEEVPLGELPPVQEMPVSAVPAEKKPKSKKGLIIAIIAVVVLLAVLAVCFFTVHIWEDATCRKPQTCSLCGATQGSPVAHSYTEASCTEDSYCRHCGQVEEEAWGHSWQGANCEAPKTCATCGEVEGTAGGHTWRDATCHDPKTCTTCGTTEGAAAGHDWAPATYTAPQTCRRCGATTGSIRGYYEQVSGTWEAFNYNYSNTYAFVLDTPLKKCKEFTIEFTPEFYHGAFVSDWKAMYRDGNGVWYEIDHFYLSSDGVAYGTFTFSTPVHVTAIAVLPGVSGGYSYSFDFIVVDVYTAE